MLSAYEKDKIREGVHRIRQEHPEATEDQMYRMLLFVAANMGTPFDEESAAEAKQLIHDNIREFDKALN